MPQADVDQPVFGDPQDPRASHADVRQSVFAEPQDPRVPQPAAVQADEPTVVQESPAEEAQYVETLSAEERRARAGRRAAAVAGESLPPATAGVPQQRGVALAESRLLAESEQQAEAFAAAQREAAVLAESGDHVVVEEPVAVVEEPPLVFQPVPDQPTVVFDGPAVVVDEEVVDVVEGPGSFEERAWPGGEFEADRTHVGTPPGYGPPPAPSQPWRSSS